MPYKTKDYPRKGFQNGEVRAFSSEKSLESSNINFGNNTTRNSPLSSRSQKELRKDSFDKNSIGNSHNIL